MATSISIEVSLEWLIKLVDDLDAVIPEENKGLLDEVDKVHDDIDTAFRELQKKVGESGGGGMKDQLRLQAQELEDVKVDLRARDIELQRLSRENISLEARLSTAEEEAKQEKALKRELSKQLDRDREKHEDELRRARSQVGASGGGGVDGGGKGHVVDPAALQEANFDLQQQLLRSQQLLQREDSELQRALLELQGLAEANDELGRRLAAATRQASESGDDLVMAHAELEAAARARAEAEATCEEAVAEAESLRQELSSVVPELERQKLELQASVRLAKREAAELRETALGGRLDATVATIDELRKQLDASRQASAALGAERDQLFEDREVLEQVIHDLSSEALQASLNATGQPASSAANLDQRESSAARLAHSLGQGAHEALAATAALQHRLEVAMAANAHLGQIASERAAELEAVMAEARDLARGDKGKEALLDEQKTLRHKLRECRKDLDGSHLRHRDAEEAKLHLEAKAEAMHELLKGLCEGARQRLSDAHTLRLKPLPSLGGDSAEALGDAREDSRSRSRDRGEAAAVAAAAEAAASAAVAEADALMAEPLAARHQTVAMRLRGQVRALEEELRDKDDRVASLYDRLRDQAQALAEAEAAAEVNHASRLQTGAPAFQAFGRAPSFASKASGDERERKLEADLDAARTEVRRLKAEIDDNAAAAAQAQAAAARGQGDGQLSARRNDTRGSFEDPGLSMVPGNPSRSVNHLMGQLDLTELKADILRTVQDALAHGDALSPQSRQADQRKEMQGASASPAGDAAPGSARASADLEAKIERRILEQMAHAQASGRSRPGSVEGTPRATPRSSAPTPRTTLLGEVPPFAVSDAEKPASSVPGTHRRSRSMAVPDMASTTASLRARMNAILGRAKHGPKHGPTAGTPKGASSSDTGQAAIAAAEVRAAAAEAAAERMRAQAQRSEANREAAEAAAEAAAAALTVAATPGTGRKGNGQSDAGDADGGVLSVAAAEAAQANSKRQAAAAVAEAEARADEREAALVVRLRAAEDRADEAEARAALAMRAAAAMSAEPPLNNGDVNDVNGGGVPSSCYTSAAQGGSLGTRAGLEAVIEELATGMGEELAAMEARHAAVHEALDHAELSLAAAEAEANRLAEENGRLHEQASLKVELQRILAGGIPVQALGGAHPSVPRLKNVGLAQAVGPELSAIGAPGTGGSGSGGREGGSGEGPATGRLVLDDVSSGRLASSQRADEVRSARKGSATSSRGSAPATDHAAGHAAAPMEEAEMNVSRAGMDSNVGENTVLLAADGSFLRGGGNVTVLQQTGGRSPAHAPFRGQPPLTGGVTFAGRVEQTPGQPQQGLSGWATPFGTHSASRAERPPPPSTGAGKALLAGTLLKEAALPPEEWAEEVSDALGRLACCLELLAAREEELKGTHELVKQHEASLTVVRKRTAALYAEHLDFAHAAEATEAAYRAALEAKQADCEKAMVQRDAWEALANASGKQTAGSLDTFLKQLTRKAAALEVNEMVLRRRCAALEETAKEEAALRVEAERCGVEAEAELKSRLLYLEEWKLGASERLERQAASLETSAPRHEFECLARDLDTLREDHLALLGKEAELRLAVHKTRHLPTKLADLERRELAHQAALAASKAATAEAEAVAAAALAEMKESAAFHTGKSHDGGRSQSALLSRQASELVDLHGANARLTAQLAASAAVAQGHEAAAARATIRLAEAAAEADGLRKAAAVCGKELQLARARRDEVLHKYGASGDGATGGLTAAEAELLRSRIKALEKEREGLRRERGRHAEVARQAAEQATQVLALRDAHGEEVSVLRARCAELEGASDDNAIIGRLQRQLAATRSSYKQFVRKYEAALGRARRKEGAARRFEERLDARERGFLALGEEKRLQVSALKAALAQVTGRLLLGDQAIDIARKTQGAAAGTAVGDGLGDGNAALDALLAGSGAAGATPEGLRRQMHALRTANDEAMAAAAAAEARAVAMEEHVKAAEVHGEATQALRVALAPILEGKLSGQASSSAPQARDLAKRLVALSEESRRQKLEVLRLKGQVTKLREGKKHAEAQVASREEAIVELEEARIEAETDALLLRGQGKGDVLSPKPLPSKDSESGGRLPAGLLPPDLSLSISRPLIEAAHLQRGRVARFQDPMGDKRGMSVEAEPGPSASQAALATGAAVAAAVAAAKEPLVKQVAEALGQLAGLRVELEGCKEALGARHRDIAALSNDVKFYAKQADSHGLSRAPSSAVRQSSALPHLPEEPLHAPFAGVGVGGLGREDVEQLKKVSSTTIASLQTVIEEKNRMIERFKAKLAAVRADQSRGNVDDRAAVERLTDKLYQENEDAIGQLKSAATALERAGNSGGPNGGGGDGGMDVVGSLYRQLEEAAMGARGREETIGALELKLRTALNARERAEQRCGAALGEMERMKADMLLLAAQVQDAEERAINGHPSHGVHQGPPQVQLAAAAACQPELQAPDPAEPQGLSRERAAALSAQLASKDKKLAALRQAIVSLKQQFEEAELAHEQQRLSDEAGRRKKEAEGGRDDAAEQVSDLRAKLGTMQKALQQATVAAEGEVAKARRAVDRLKADKARLKEEREGQDRRVGQLESEVSALQDAVAAARKEAERQRNRADKLVRSTNKLTNPATDGSGGGAGGGDSPGFDSGETSKLRAENERLVATNAALRSDLEDVRRRPTDESPRRVSGAAPTSSSPADGMTPQASSSMAGGGQNNLERCRAAERTAKKLSERLEKQGLKLSDAEAEASSLRAKVEALLKAKAEVEKRLAGISKEAARLKAGGSEGLDDLEASRKRVFALEEANGQLMRRAEVELPTEIARLRAELSDARGALQRGLGGPQAANRGKRDGFAGGGPGRSMLESEDAFLVAEQLRDQVASLSEAKKALELQLLGTDAGALEARFDLGLKAQEAERLARRVRELEAANAMLGGGGSSGGGAGGGERGAGGRFNRERDLEGVVEGLQKVVHKLKAENDRLRAGAGEQVKVAAAQRAAKEARERLSALEEEAGSLRARAMAGDDAASKLASRHEQLSQAKKSLRQRDDDLRLMGARAEAAERQAAATEEEARQASLRVKALEGEVERLKRLGLGGGNAGGSSVQEASELRSEVQRLNGALADARAAITSQRGVAQGKASAGEAAELAAARGEVRRLQDRLAAAQGGDAAALKAENAKLREELSAFDLDFFEEIEDLKYKYAEAVRKLQAYEGRR